MWTRNKNGIDLGIRTLALLALCTVASCSNTEAESSADELNVLGQSSFYPGQSAPGATAAAVGTPTTDDGNIPIPTQPKNPEDDGVIPPPVTPPTPVPPVVVNPTDPTPVPPSNNPEPPPVVVVPPPAGPTPGPVPPVVDNGPVLPPTTDDGSIPTPPAPPGTPGDEGTIPTVPPIPPVVDEDEQPNPDDGELPYCDAHACPTLNIKLSRACSYMRSGIPFPSFIFFEEATTPVLALEGSLAVSNIAEWMGRPGVHAVRGYNGRGTVNILLSSKDLTGVDLISAPHETSFQLAVEAIKAQFPNSYRNIKLQFRVCQDSNGNGQCSDETGVRLLSVNTPTTKIDALSSQYVLTVWSGRNLNISNNRSACEQQISPLVLDMNGDGIRLVGPNAGVYFDIDAAGEKVLTGWTDRRRDDAFLVRDLNGDGVIESGAELFGSATVLADGTRASNGFEALKDLDSDRNGVFDARDSAYSELKLWTDRNRNGLVDSGETQSLSDGGVVAIQLNYQNIMEVDPYGNETRQRSTFKMKVGGVSVYRQVIDVWFNTLQNMY